MSRVAMCMSLWLSLGVAAVLTACSGGGGNAPPLAGDTSTLDTSRSADGVVSNAAGPVNWSIQAGASTLDQAFQDLDFYANTITIDAGDSVTWRVAAIEPHTVSFLAPHQTPPPPDSPQAVTPAGGKTEDGTTFTSSGLLMNGKTFATYTLTFPKPGTYVFHCLLHQPQMMGTIIVQKAGTPYPHTQSFYTHIGSVDEWKDLNAAAASVALFPFTVRGTTFAAGIAPGLATGPPADDTVVRFLNINTPNNLSQSGNLTIKVGTKLTWVDESNNEPHTVTFPPAGHGPPNISPFSPPSGGTTYDGTHLVNSGVLLPVAFLPGQRTTFSLTFTKVGSYKYFCLFHFPEGMTGVINVTK
ncbi:MAG: cupredoxin domain-containing protein [Vulcanimicrobiaceae bacterium]